MRLIIDILEAMYRHYRKVWHKRRGTVPESYIAFGTPLTKEEWIPVSDPLNELPTDRRLLVIVLEEYGYRYVTDLYWDMTEWSDIYYARKAIAYMSYPEPYEADKEEEK